VVFSVAIAAFSRIPLLPDIGDDLSLTPGEIGLLTTAFGLGRLGMDLPAGRLSQAAPPYVALAGAGFALALSCALLAVSESLLEALGASTLMGCASALTNTTGMYAFATTGGAGHRGASMALFTTALLSGQMLGPALGGALGSLLGWRSSLAIAASIGALVAVTCFAWRHRVRGIGDAEDSANRGRDRHAAGNASRRAARVKSLSRGELLALAATPFASFFALAGLTQTLVPLIGAGELDLSASAIGLAIGVGAAIRFVAAWVAGIGSDRLSRKIVLVPSLGLMSLGAAVLAVPTGAAWAGAIALLAIGSAAISVAAAALADRVPAERLGHELGVFRLVGDLGLLVGPAAAAFLYQESGRALAGGVSAAVFAAAALVAAVWTQEPTQLDVGGPREARGGEGAEGLPE